jgi:protein-S-isoprenylcysteine O-methyltransferase Ste14
MALPPTYFAVALVAMGVLHFLVPIWRPIRFPVSYLGIPPIGVGLWMVLTSARLFDQAETTIKPFEESSTLVTEGLFRYTRNPIYLGMVLVLIGAAFALGSLTAFLVIPIFVRLIQERFIRHEEAALTEKFGSEYVDYQGRVRRWV